MWTRWSTEKSLDSGTWARLPGRCDNATVSRCLLLFSLAVCPRRHGEHSFCSLDRRLSLALGAFRGGRLGGSLMPHHGARFRLCFVSQRTAWWSRKGCSKAQERPVRDGLDIDELAGFLRVSRVLCPSSCCCWSQVSRVAPECHVASTSQMEYPLVAVRMVSDLRK